MSLLAHTFSDNSKQQSLRKHSEQVARYSRCFLMGLELENSAYLIGLLHDLGKSNTRFQNHLLGNADQMDHAFVGAKYIYNRYKKDSNIYLYLSALCIMSHHSYLLNLINADGNSDFLHRINKQEDYYESSCDNFFQEVVSQDKVDEIFYKGKEEVKEIVLKISKRYQGNTYGPMFRFEIGMLMKLCYSALIDADCFDTSQFYQGIPFSIEEMMYSPPWDVYYHNLLQHLNSLETETEIDIMRRQISQQCDEFSNKEQGIYRMNVPTGGGKTLASLRFALKHAIKHDNIKHIYYVIPYLTILDQTSKSIEDILFPDDPPKAWEFLQHYSNIIVDDEEEHLKYTQRWNSAIVLTSMVRFMDTLFKGRKSDARRMHQLSNSIIIFDEIQTLPPKLMHMFNTAVNFLHNVCHSTVLLCTATQPCLHEMARPLQISKSADIIKNAEELYQDMKRVDIIDRCFDGGSTLDHIAEDAFEFLTENRQVMIIVNTKRQALELFQIMMNRKNQDILLYHLSTSMCVAHRKHILHDIREKLDQDKPLCLISTSLIEAGVDISFPCVIRALAGMDSIIQCAGRCNRHNELKKKRRKGKVFIYEIAKENLSSNGLKSIALGKKCTKCFLNTYKKYPQDFDYDLTSLKAMQYYYKQYQKEMKLSEYDYPYDNQTLYDLLSKQHKNVDDAMLGNFAIAFKDAGKQFCVIEHNSEDVIVPYEGKTSNKEKRMDGKEIISILLSDRSSFVEKQDALKAAQNYSVGLYTDQIIAIGSPGLLKLECGAWILSETYYDERMGVNIDGDCSGIIL